MANLMTHRDCLPGQRARDWAGAPCRRFLGDESGASLPLVAAVLIPLMGFIGLGVDASRGYLIKARLGDALDAAVLASAHVTDGDDSGQHNGQLKQELENYFNANFPPGYMGATVELGTAVVDNDEETITVSAVATLDTTFMSLFGFKSLQIGSETEVTMRTVAMDVVLSIDMSGSMNNSDGSGSTRIASARTAAKKLVDILFGSDSIKDELLIGLVPWNDKVNVSIANSTYDPFSLTTQAVPTFINPITGLSQSVVYYANNTPVPLLAEPAADWDGCVFARYLHNTTNDDDADHLLGPVTAPDGTEWPAWVPSQVAGGGGTDDDDDDDDDDGGGLWNGYASYPCLVRGLTPMTHERSVIDDEIDNLTSPTGTTNIAQGLGWAWRLVSPYEPFTEADPFPTGLHKRAVILLTDGQQYGGTGDGYQAAFGSGTSAGPNGLDDRLRAIADNMKAQGVEIYTIQYYYSSGPLQALLQEVATEPQAPYYHFAPDGDELEKIFKEIAKDLSALRISR